VKLIFTIKTNSDQPLTFRLVHCLYINDHSQKEILDKLLL